MVTQSLIAQLSNTTFALIRSKYVAVKHANVMRYTDC